uniref:Type II secretory pathway, component ExeA (Predicted ATPase) n=1 Tax=Candidatus Kentrum sp. LPFa TaxID=2126335 RepID=A0A450W4V4_9GAMM|nr:MAG: Type II secretory pathway, component ExeA (predicted ATPase) [Candidatus Kentron sp. LPFa]
MKEHPLKTILRENDIPQRELADCLGASETTISLWLGNDRECNAPDRDARVTRFLIEKGAIPPTRKGWRPDTTGTPPPTTKQKDIEMYLTRQRLDKETLQHFRLFQDPFQNEVQERADVYLTRDAHYAREAMWQGKSRSFLAILGEPGCGKTILRRDLFQRAQEEDQSLIIIQPYVTGMEEREDRGKPLRARHIAEAIIDTLSPGARIPQSSQRRNRLVHELLRASHQGGATHALIIDEAQSIPKPTLWHLKRLIDETRDGHAQTIGVILLGQTKELGAKLSPQDATVREVTQRIGIITLGPLDNEIGPYLAHKFKRHKVDPDKIMEKDAPDALRTRLTLAGRNRNGRDAASIAYPLAVNNLMTAAMNATVRIGGQKVTGEIITEL